MQPPQKICLCLIAALNLAVQAQTALPSVQWQFSYGGTSNDLFWELDVTSDGGYVLAGYSASNPSGNKITTNYGNFDYCVVKLDSQGGVMWEQNYGGSSADQLRSIKQTSDSGYICAGYSASTNSGNKTSGWLGQSDYWILKLDSTGNRDWEKTFGGSRSDQPAKVRETKDGGYILAGISTSTNSGNKATTNYGSLDAWILKLDAVGNKVWEQNYGGANHEDIVSVEEIPNGDFYVTGSSESAPSGNKTSANFGKMDYWVLRLNASGNKVWEQTFGGSEDDVCWGSCATSVGNIFLVGVSASGVSGTKTSPSFGFQDAWIIKLDSSGEKIWEKTYGGNYNDGVKTIFPTTDGGFILGGTSSSPASGN